MFFITVAYFGRELGPTYTMLTIVSISLAGLGMLIYFKKPLQPVTSTLKEKHIIEPSVQPLTRIIPIKTDAAVAEKN